MMKLTGIVKTSGAYEIKGKDGIAKKLISMNVVDEMANTFACQMWPDDPQHAQLVTVIDSARRQPVQLDVVGYTVRMRKFQDGTEKPQANFVVSNVVFLNQGQS